MLGVELHSKTSNLGLNVRVTRYETLLEYVESLCLIRMVHYHF